MGLKVSLKVISVQDKGFGVRLKVNQNENKFQVPRTWELGNNIVLGYVDHII